MEESGLTAADEMLYPENRSYLDDVLSYEAVGARSVENQQHRLTASGMEIPVGMKNPTSGDLSVMLNSIQAAQSGHTFLYRGWDVSTTGNPLAHAILRGGVDKYGTCVPNYHYEDLMRLWELYQKRGSPSRRRWWTPTTPTRTRSTRSSPALSARCSTAAAAAGIKGHGEGRDDRELFGGGLPAH